MQKDTHSTKQREAIMQIRGLSQILSNITTPHPSQTLAPKDQMFEIDNRTSRHMEHAKKEKHGWKPSKHDLHTRSRQRGHMQNRGASHRLGDARAAKAEM